MYWVFASMVVLIGLGLSIYFGQETVSIPKITYNHYGDPGKFAEALISGMEDELKGAPLVMLGVTPGRKIDLEIWKAFLEQTSAGDLKYSAVIVDPELPLVAEFFPNAIKMDLKKDIARFVEGAKNARSQTVRMAVIVPSIYASQLLENNPADTIKKNSDLKPTSFSLMGFPRTPEQEASMEIPCVMGQNDHDGVGAMGCEAQKKARLLYRKKSKPGFYEAVIDQVGERDYLVLVNAP